MSHFFSPSANGFFNADLTEQRPADCISLTDEQYAKLLHDLNSGGTIAIVAGNPTAVCNTVTVPKEDVFAAYKAALDQMLTATAQRLGYSSMVEAVSYIGDPNTEYDVEARALRDYRSLVETDGFAKLKAANPHQIDAKAIAQFIDSLPKPI